MNAPVQWRTVAQLCECLQLVYRDAFARTSCDLASVKDMKPEHIDSAQHEATQSEVSICRGTDRKGPARTKGKGLRYTLRGQGHTEGYPSVCK